MATQMDLRQSVLRSALGMAGSGANATADTLFPLIDAEIAKLFEDRNILITDGGTLTFTGTQIQFTENLNLTLNSKTSGAVPQVISLGSASQTFTNSGDMWVAVVNRTAGTATTSIVAAGSALPAVTSANQEVFLLAKRVDAGDGTQRLYFRTGAAMSAGQSLRLGAGGGSSSTGNGTGDDLDSLTFRASFNDSFPESASNSNSAVDGSAGKTNATYNAAKSMYVLNYDASKTVTGAGTGMTLSGSPSFTVAVGDVLVVNGEARKIATVTSQTVYVLESAFTNTPLPSALQATVSQALYTKDVYNLSVDGSAISTAFGSLTFSEIMLDYKESTASGSNVFVPNTTAKIGYTATNDNTTFTLVQKRATNGTDTTSSVTLPSAGTSLYLRFFSNATSGSGTVNLISYRAFMQRAIFAASPTMTQLTVTADTVMQPNYAYVVNKPSTQAIMTLPASATVGDRIQIMGCSANGWIIYSNTSSGVTYYDDSIVRGSLTGASTPFSYSTSAHSQIELVYSNTNEWSVFTKNGTSIGGNYYGTGADGDVVISSNTNLTPSTINSAYDAEAVVKNYNSLTINSSTTLTLTQPARGLIIYIKGNLVVNGTLSMTRRGAFVNPTTAGVVNGGLTFRRIKTGQTGTNTLSSPVAGMGAAAVAAEANQPPSIGNGISYTIPIVGGSGGVSSGAGGTITNGMGGGGAGGAYNAAGGNGAAGTCFSGGSGGAGGGLEGGSVGGAGAAFGGQGGSGTGSAEGGGGGGAGNPNGTSGNAGSTPGTGGLLVIIVKGNVTIGATGSIEAKGAQANPSDYGGGGGSGGGVVLLLYGGTLSNSGTISAAAGAAGVGNVAGTAGGVGTVITTQIDQ